MTRDADPAANPAKPEATDAPRMVRLRFLHRATMPCPGQPMTLRLFKPGLLIDLPEAEAADFIARGVAVPDNRPDAPPSFAPGWRRGLAMPPPEVDARRRAAALADAREWLEVARPAMLAAAKYERCYLVTYLIRKVWTDAGTLDPDKLAALLARAETDREAFDAAKYVAIGRLIFCGGDMPAALAKFAGEVLADERKPPVKRGQPPKSELRDWLLAQGVSFIAAKHGLFPTRSPTSPPESACDILAEAMAGLKMRPSSYAAIEAIWHRHKDRCIRWL